MTRNDENGGTAGGASDSSSIDSLLRDVARADGKAPLVDLVGKTLAHFRVRAKLGQGGMGVVYLALDEKLKRDVALKVLPASAETSPAQRQRFLREARAAAAITHACIAAVYEIGEAEGHAFIAMELVKGSTLRERMSAGLSITESVRIARDVARGLAKAHERGVVHRDLKPDNVMLTDEGEVKILDFGIAKMWEANSAGGAGDALADTATPETGPVTAQGHVMGTPAYMSPEQARGEAADARSDVFSFGAMLYEMLCGVRPFQGDIGIAVLYAVIHTEPAKVEIVNPAVPAGLASLVTKCLAKARDKRFASGRELAAALDNQIGSGESRAEELRASGESRVAPNIVVRSSEGALVSGERTELAATMTPESLIVAPVALVAPPATSRAARQPEPGDDGRALEEVRARRSRRWMIGSVAVVGTLLVGGAFASRGRTASPSDGASPALSAASMVPDAAPRGVPMTAHPPPKTGVPAAALAYASALQAWRDGSLSVASDLMGRAVELDPSMAAAQLRTLFYRYELPVTALREVLAVTTRLRAQLDERDLALLSVADAILAEPTDPVEALRRSLAAVKRFPDDAEVRFIAGVRTTQTNDRAGARKLFSEALSLDPEFAGAAVNLANTWSAEGNMAQAIESFDRCIARFPTATTCIRVRARLYEAEGDCAAVEKSARQLVRIEPTAPRAYKLLGRAFAGRGAAEESVREAFDKAVALGGEAHPLAYGRLLETLWLSYLAGDLTTAERVLRETDRAAAADTSESTHGNIATALLQIANERGDAEEEERIIASYERRSAAWTSDYAGSIRLPILVAKYRARRIGDAEFEAERDRMFNEQMRFDPIEASWVGFYGPFWFGTPRPEEVRNFAARVAAHPAPNIFGLDASLVGQGLLLAGDLDGALPWLERGAAACTLLPDDDVPTNPSTIDFLRAQLHVGEAREAKGNVDGACAAYRVVLDRWPNPKPRSVTREAAARRFKALQCKRSAP